MQHWAHNSRRKFPKNFFPARTNIICNSTFLASLPNYSPPPLKTLFWSQQKCTKTPVYDNLESLKHKDVRFEIVWERLEKKWRDWRGGEEREMKRIGRGGPSYHIRERTLNYRVTTLIWGGPNGTSSSTCSVYPRSCPTIPTKVSQSFCISIFKRH